MTRVLIHQRQMPVYQVPMMERLCERFPETTIVYGKESRFSTLSNAKTNQSNFVQRKWLYPTKRSTLFFSPIFFLLLRFRPDVIITEGSVGNLTIPWLLLLRPILGFKLIMWGHGWNRVKGLDPNRTKLDRYRILLQKWCDALVFYSSSAKKRLGEYLPEAKMFVATNTIDSTIPKKIYQRLLQEGRDQVKQRLQFKNEVNIIYLGRLTQEKNLMVLLDLMSFMKDKDLAIHFVGSGDMEGALKERCDKDELKDVQFHGHISDQDKIGELLFASDMMFIPGKVGLGVVHSFNFALPVIVFDSDEHSPEIDFVKDGENGMILKERSLSAISEAVERITTDQGFREKLRSGALKTTETTVNTELFLDGFENAIQYVLNHNGKDSAAS